MADTSLIIGNGNWAVKETSLLGYNIIQNKYVPIEMTVSRNSTGTRVNNAGKIEISPKNLFSYSQTFDNTSTAGWYNTGLNSTVIPNVLATSAPNGTFTADKLVATAVLGSHLILQTPAGSVSGSTVTASVFAKAAELTKMVVLNNQGGGGECNFILSGAGSYTIVSGVSADIQPYPDGWYRCIITYTPSTTGLFNVHIKLLNNSGVPSFLGNGSDGIYLWGAQLETGTTATEYFPTTDRFNVPRVDYLNSTTGSLLVEPARTNSVLYSEQFDNGYWNKTNVTVTPNTTTAPDGTTTADNVNITATSGYLSRSNLTFANSTSYTISIFVKKSATTGNKNFRFYYNNNASVPINSLFSCLVDLTNITATTTTSGTIPPTILSTKLVNYGNNWYRVEVAFTTSALGGNSVSEIGLQPPSGGPVVDFDAWGAQLELGSNATSYIPTTISALARNADVITKTEVSSLIGQTEGTIFVEFNNTLMTYAGNGYLIRIFADANNEVWIRKEGSSNKYSARWRANATNVYTESNISVIDGNNKIAIAYKSTDSAVYLNGNEIGTNAGTGTFSVAPSIIAIGSTNVGDFFNDRIELATVFQTRLSKPQCETLTTL